MAASLCAFCPTERPGLTVLPAKHGKKGTGKYKPHCGSCKRVARGALPPRAQRAREAAAAADDDDDDAEDDEEEDGEDAGRSAHQTAQQRPPAATAAGVSGIAPVDINRMASACATAAVAAFQARSVSIPSNFGSMIETVAAAAAAAAVSAMTSSLQHEVVGPARRALGPSLYPEDRLSNLYSVMGYRIWNPASCGLVDRRSGTNVHYFERCEWLVAGEFSRICDDDDFNRRGEVEGRLSDTGLSDVRWIEEAELAQFIRLQAQTERRTFEDMCKHELAEYQVQVWHHAAMMAMVGRHGQCQWHGRCRWLHKQLLQRQQCRRARRLQRLPSQLLQQPAGPLGLRHQDHQHAHEPLTTSRRIVMHRVAPDHRASVLGMRINVQRAQSLFHGTVSGTTKTRATDVMHANDLSILALSCVWMQEQ
jgi:hypothetical protein